MKVCGDCDWRILCASTFPVWSWCLPSSAIYRNRRFFPSAALLSRSGIPDNWSRNKTGQICRGAPRFLRFCLYTRGKQRRFFLRFFFRAGFDVFAFRVIVAGDNFPYRPSRSINFPVGHFGHVSPVSFGPSATEPSIFSGAGAFGEFRAA